MGSDMGVSYSSATKSTRMTAVISAIDSQVLAGFIEIGTTNMGVVLASINFQKPSFSEAGGKITMLGAPRSGVAAASGTAAVARIKDGAGNTWVTGLTVGTFGTDIILNSTMITAGQTVTIVNGTITHG
jgi:hypothetical protein